MDHLISTTMEAYALGVNHKKAEYTGVDVGVNRQLLNIQPLKV
jgi:hypothetical protein